jgi:hypothetical protein
MLFTSKEIRKFASDIEPYILLTVEGIVPEIDIGLLIVV